MIISFSRLADFICDCHKPGCPYILGIDGMSASGKSTFAERLKKAIDARGHDCFIIPMDDLFSPELHRDTLYPGFDMDRIKSGILDRLKEGKSVGFRRYDKESKAMAGYREIPENAVILFEGVFTTGKLLGDFMDLRIWLDCPREKVLERGEARSGNPRTEWESKWLPAEDAYMAGEAPFGASDMTVDGAWEGDGEFRAASIRNSLLSEKMTD
jgi:uridine kinase